MRGRAVLDFIGITRPAGARSWRQAMRDTGTVAMLGAVVGLVVAFTSLTKGYTAVATAGAACGATLLVIGSVCLLLGRRPRHRDQPPPVPVSRPVDPRLVRTGTTGGDATGAAPALFLVDQETLGRLPLADAFTRVWVDGRRHRDTRLSISAAFPDVTAEELATLRRLVEEVDRRAGEWCQHHWGKPDGVPLETLYEQISAVVPELSREAVDLLVDWNMFLAR